MFAQFFLLIGRTILFFAVVLPLVGPKAHAADEAKRSYAIVVEKETTKDASWKDVVKALRIKHSAKVFYWDDGGLDGVRKKLAALRPDYVCFVARPDELARKAKVKAKTKDGRTIEMPLCGMYYRNVGVLMQSLDKDPYDDAIWAVLTGATPEDALRVIAAKPLTVRRALSHVSSGRLEWFESGASFSECKQGQKWVKMPGKPPKEVKGPDDTTEQFVKAVNSGKADIISSSGHATEHDWQMGYSYRNGQFATPTRIARLPQAAKNNYQKLLAKGGVGRLFAVDSSNKVYAILADNPKIYYSPGNCRIARVDGENCMALGWIHHGAMQFFGHVGLQTRSCYAWGVADYFMAQQGRFSFAESVWLNQQALRLALSQMSEKDRQSKYICCRNERPIPAGREFFWETVVLYGDPAWEARVKPVTDPQYDQQMQSKTLADGRTELTFTVKMRRAGAPGRPAAFLLDNTPVSKVEVKEGPENMVVADNFALVPFWKSGAPAPKIGDTYKAVVVVTTR